MKRYLFSDKATACRQLAWALLLLCLFPFTASAQQQDKLLTLLRDRLNYNFAQLQKQTVKPYFMSYRVEDNGRAEQQQRQPRALVYPAGARRFHGT